MKIILFIILSLLANKSFSQNKVYLNYDKEEVHAKRRSPTGGYNCVISESEKIKINKYLKLEHKMQLYVGKLNKLIDKKNQLVKKNNTMWFSVIGIMNKLSERVNHNKGLIKRYRKIYNQIFTLDKKANLMIDKANRLVDKENKIHLLNTKAKYILIKSLAIGKPSLYALNVVIEEYKNFFEKGDANSRLVTFKKIITNQQTQMKIIKPFLKDLKEVKKETLIAKSSNKKQHLLKRNISSKKIPNAPIRVTDSNGVTHIWDGSCFRRYLQYKNCFLSNLTKNISCEEIQSPNAEKIGEKVGIATARYCHQLYISGSSKKCEKKALNEVNLDIEGIQTSILFRIFTKCKKQLLQII